MQPLGHAVARGGGCKTALELMRPPSAGYALIQAVFDLAGDTPAASVKPGLIGGEELDSLKETQANLQTYLDDIAASEIAKIPFLLARLHSDLRLSCHFSPHVGYLIYNAGGKLPDELLEDCFPDYAEWATEVDTNVRAFFSACLCRQQRRRHAGPCFCDATLADRGLSAGSNAMLLTRTCVQVPAPEQSMYILVTLRVDLSEILTLRCLLQGEEGVFYRSDLTRQLDASVGNIATRVGDLEVRVSLEGCTPTWGVTWSCAAAVDQRAADLDSICS